MPANPYELICSPDKTTLTCPGGIALGFGPGPGLRNAIFWNRIGSLFSCYRPAVAVLNVFDARDLHRPLALKPGKTRWEPNLVTAHYTAGSLRVEERRTALKAGLRYLLKLRSTAKRPRELVLFFHGQAIQQPFFDYRRGLPEPLINCEVQPHLRRIRLTQPHPHSGLGDVSSIQTVTASHALDAYGFGADSGDLAALWQDHGALACLRLRLGQVGGRLPPPDLADGTDLVFQHRHPLYYFALRVRLEPGELQLASIALQYQTDDEGGKVPGPFDGTAPDEWQEYLRTEGDPAAGSGDPQNGRRLVEIQEAGVDLRVLEEDREDQQTGEERLEGGLREPAGRRQGRGGSFKRRGGRWRSSGSEILSRRRRLGRADPPPRAPSSPRARARCYDLGGRSGGTVDAGDLKSPAARRPGSSPGSGK